MPCQRLQYNVYHSCIVIVLAYLLEIDHLSPTLTPYPHKTVLHVHVTVRSTCKLEPHCSVNDIHVYPITCRII